MFSDFKLSLSIFLIVLFTTFGISNSAFAQTASSSEIINAEILSDLWYSTTTINAKDIITIYAGFQNHSNKNLSGTASFYIDDQEIYKSSFLANPKSLTKLETQYLALAGDHKSQVKITEIKEILNKSEIILNINNLLSSESEKKNLSVEQKITKEVVLEKAENVANIIVNTTNKYADSLGDYIESFKKPTKNTKNSLVLKQNNPSGEVLGTSTINIKTKDDEGGFSFFNFLLDSTAYLVRHWVWVLSSIFIYIIYSMLRKD